MLILTTKGMVGSFKIMNEMRICAGNVVWRLVISCVLLWPSLVRGLQQTFDRQSLDSFLGEYALKNASSRRTGILYDVLLPANFSGMEASVVRFRSGSLWKRGANFSLFHIPPNILPVPFVRRINIVFSNLGNWSASYYNVSNHTLVAPVVGLLGSYDADGASSSYRIIEFRVMKDPILVRFPNISLADDDANANASMRCVRFGINGAVEFSNVTIDGLCVARGQGHFSLVIPTPTPPPPPPEAWKWWAVGFGVGVGVVGLLFVGILMYKVVKQKRVGRMQKQSEKSEALDAVWVGRSRMPYASAIRTQPVLEDNYVP